MSENCCCDKEKKEFCVVYTIEGGEERHVVIIAKDEQDAIHQFYTTAKIINSLIGMDDLGLIVNRVYQEC